MEFHTALCFSNIICLSSLVIFTFFLCGRLALQFTWLDTGASTIIIILVLASLVMLCSDRLELPPLVATCEERLNQGLFSTVRHCCPSGCHRHAQPVFLRCLHCNLFVEPKEHNHNICCACFFVMVTRSYVTMVLLSCLICPVLVSQLSLITAKICFTMTFLAIVYLCLTGSCVLRAQHNPRSQATTMADSRQGGQESLAEPEAIMDRENIAE